MKRKRLIEKKGDDRTKPGMTGMENP